MKLLIVCHDCNLYGANLSLLDLLEHYNRNNCEITVIIPKENTDFEKRLIKTGVKVIIFNYIYPLKILSNTLRMKIRNLIKNLSEKFFIRSKVDQVVKLLKDEKFDCVISNTFATLFGYYIAKKLGSKHCFYVREFMEDGLKIQHFRKVEDICKDSYAIYISKSIEKYYSEKYKFKKAIQIYDNIRVDLDNIKLKQINKDNLNICMVGSLQEIKGQTDIITAVSLLEKEGYNITLNIVGNGPDYNMLKKLSESLGLKNCNFLGQLSDVSEIYKQSDISTICSKQEALGRVTVESLAAGLYVIGTIPGETGYLLADNRGLSYEFKDSRQLANKIKEVVETNGAGIDREKNIEFVRNNFVKPILPVIIDFVKEMK